jgi:hypothetical protein
MLQTVSFKEVGADAPQEIKRARRQVMDMLRKSGQPVILKHRFSTKDVENGVAKTCPACWDEDLQQTRGDCPVCFRVGYVSVEDDPTNYIDNRGRLTTDPSTGVAAPLFGGFGQGYLTWMIEPDASVDVFKPDEAGVMVQTQQAQGYAPWYPTLFDNDLCINVSLARDGQTVLSTNERWELKLVNPNTIRGWGSLPSGVVHNVWQTFEMARAPDNTIFYQVPVEIRTASPLKRYAPKGVAAVSVPTPIVSHT